jgi:Holliday junction resolvasome RuvABC endonuclease subunit
MGIMSAMKSKYADVDRVLGLDASTNSLGFCIYGKNGPEEWGEIMFRGSSVFERLSYAEKTLNQIADRFDVDLIIFESAVFVQNKKTVILLAYAFGAVVSTLMHSGAKVEDVNPMNWQRFIGNPPLTKEEKAAIVKEFPDKSKGWYGTKSRDIRKQRTMDWAEEKFGIKVESDNVSDAIGVAHYGYKKLVEGVDNG